MTFRLQHALDWANKRRKEQFPMPPSPTIPHTGRVHRSEINVAYSRQEILKNALGIWKINTHGGGHDFIFPPPRLPLGKSGLSSGKSPLSAHKGLKAGPGKRKLWSNKNCEWR